MTDIKAVYQNTKESRFICEGPEAETFKQQAKILCQGDLPSGWQRLNSSKFSLMAELTGLNNSCSLVYFKAYLPRNAWEKIKALMRGSRCERARKQANKLRSNGFNTPQIRCWGKVENIEFMIADAVGGVGIGHYISSYLREPLTAETRSWKRYVIRMLGAQIAELHRCGIAHGDLKPTNILMEYKTSPPTFHFIDNERNRHQKIISMAQVIKNLTDINMFYAQDLSLTDRMRFLQAYTDTYQRFSRQQIQAICRKVMKSTKKRLARKNPNKFYRTDCCPDQLLIPDAITEK